MGRFFDLVYNNRFWVHLSTIRIKEPLFLGILIFLYFPSISKPLKKYLEIWLITILPTSLFFFVFLIGEKFAKKNTHILAPSVSLKGILPKKKKKKRRN